MTKSIVDLLVKLGFQQKDYSFEGRKALWTKYADEIVKNSERERESSPINKEYKGSARQNIAFIQFLQEKIGKENNIIDTKTAEFRRVETKEVAKSERKNLRKNIPPGGSRESAPPQPNVIQETLSRTAMTEQGRSELRRDVFNASGRAIMDSEDARYKYMRLDYLYRDIPLTINNKKVTFREGPEGMTYYYDGAQKRATWKTGDMIKPYVGKEEMVGPPLPEPPKPQESQREAPREVSVETQLQSQALTEQGRAELRRDTLNTSGRALMNSTDARYKYMRLDYLYRDIPLTINNKKVAFREGPDGRTYYYDGAQKRATWKTGDVIKPYVEKIEQRDPYFDFTKEEQKRMREYSKKYHEAEKRHDHNILNRTFEHRLEDHEILLSDMFNNRGDAKMAALRSQVFPTGRRDSVFIDIGPGIANKDLKVKSGKGKPAITLQEIAEGFPSMQCVALDLPDEVDIFTGKTPKSKAGYEIDAEARDGLLAKRNMHVVSGDGLKSLKAQWENRATNPYPERQRPPISKDATVFIRSANAIDIYCEWEKEVKPALEQTARDFKDQPVVYFFNREIMLKPAGSIEWKIVGQVSNMGFRHSGRELSRNGQPPYKLNNRISPAISVGPRLEAKVDLGKRMPY